MCKDTIFYENISVQYVSYIYKLQELIKKNKEVLLLFSQLLIVFMIQIAALLVQ